MGTGRRAWSPLFTRRVSEARRLGQRHELEYALSFAHRCGAGDPPESLALNTEPGREQALAWLERHGLDSGFLVIHAGSGGSCPPWPVPHFFELARLLAEEGWRIAFSVGPQELEVARLLDQAPPVLRHAPRLEAPLPVWAAVVQRAGAVVGNSTGPLHLAAALGCPAVGFYPPWPSCSAARWGPYSDRGWAIEARDEGALQWSAAERRARGSSLMSAMLPESVAPLVRRALLSATTARTAGSPPRAG